MEQRAIELTLFVRKEAKKIPNRGAHFFVMVFFVLYLTFIFFASYRNWFNVVSFPPKVLLYTTFPYAFLLFGIVINTAFYKKVIENTSVRSLIQLHVFRVIGVFFILLAVYDALPKPFAFIAGVGDILTAVSSIAVAKAVHNKKKHARTAAYLWNIFGFVDILLTALMANVLTKSLWIQALWA